MQTIDHVSGALGRLCEQFKRKPNIIKLVTALAQPSQAIEDALMALFTQRSINTAIGAQLDALGTIVGQARGGLSDADFRRYIRARIATNSSDGTVEELISVGRLVLNDPSSQFAILRVGVAAVLVRAFGTAINDSLASILISFLRDARDGGVKLTLESTPALDASTFFTAVTAFTTSALAIGNTSIAVDSTIGFPSSGSVTLDVGGSNVETVTYGATDATHFKNCSPLIKTHTIGARVDGPQLGQGLGDSADSGQPTLTPYSNVGTTGGRMIDARE
jgi:hypothetical protein